MKLPEYNSFDEKNTFFETNQGLVGRSCVINTVDEFDAMLNHMANTLNKIENRRQKIKDNFLHSDYFRNDTMEQHQKRFITLGLENGLLFRGVSEAKYKIFASAQRYWLEQDLGAKGIAYVDFIANLLKQAKANELLKDYYASLGIPVNDLLYMSLLQHYGQCSPLIDVSYNINTALFFAFNDAKMENMDCELDEYCSIYVFNTYGNQYWADLDVILQNGQENAIKNLETSPYLVEMIDTSNIDRPDYYVSWMNPHNNGEGLHNWKLSLVKLPMSKGAVSPITRTGQQICWTNLNLLAQQGGFFLYTNDKIPLEKYVHDNANLPNIICYNIHKSLKNDVLARIHLSEKDVYPQMKDIINQEIDTYKANLPK